MLNYNQPHNTLTEIGRWQTNKHASFNSHFQATWISQFPPDLEGRLV